MKREKKRKWVRASADVERDALAWATKAFQEKRAELLEKGYVDAHRREARDAVIELYDRYSRNGTSLLSRPFPANPLFPELFRDVSATLLERDKQLPPGLAGFAAQSLREPNRPERPGPKKTDLMARDMTIGVTVHFVKRKWGFKRTRSRFNTSYACAVSIVQKALRDAVNLNLSEADIIRASNKVERFLNASAKLLVEKPDILLSFLQENMKRMSNSNAQLLHDIDIDYEKSFARLEHLKNQPEFRQFQKLVQDGELDNIGTLKKRLRRKN